MTTTGVRLPQADSHIGTLRVRGAGEAGPGLTAELGLRLGEVDLRPPGLPPAAILVVRRLNDPRPGSVRLRRGRAEIDPAWAVAARAGLASLATRAARPADGDVPPTAPAVLFADRAELIACLLADLAAGVAASHWWWQLLLPALAPGGSAAEAMIGDAAALPAAMRLLDRRGAAVAVVASLSRPEVGRVLAAVLAVHGAPPVASGRAGLHRWPSTGTAAADRPTTDPAPTPVGRPPSPWARWVGDLEVPPELEPEHALLLGVVRLLHVRATEARRPEFAAAARRWLAAARARTAAPAAHGHAPEQAGEAPAPQQGPAGSQQVPPPARVARGGGDEVHTGVAHERHRSRRAPVPPELGPAPPPPLAATSPDPDEPVAAVPPAERLPEHAGTPAPEGVATELAGAFYLVNLARRLGLGDAFAREWQFGRRVGAWAVLEALGRAMLAGRWARDPVWAVLAGLDGRAGEVPPGRQVPDGIDYTLPHAWWDPLPDEQPAVFWAGLRGRMRLWTDLGFVLADVAQPAGAGRAAELAGAYSLPAPRRRAYAAAPVAAVRRTAAADFPPGMARWLALAEPCVRRVLGRALALPPAGAGTELLVRPGRVFATRTHVDVVLPLDAASLPVRRAGLDRDPGWVPELGRVVAYHFE